MKTITINLYSFDELTPEIQDKVINSLFDINVDHDWYQLVYDDAKNIGLKITEFDIDNRNGYCKGNILKNTISVADKIIQEYVEDCEIVKTAKQFLSDWDKLVEKYSNDIDKTKVIHENDNDFDIEADDLEKDFENNLLEGYKIILSKGYDYLTSKEQIIETIKANEYHFTIDGKLQ